MSTETIEQFYEKNPNGGYWLVEVSADGAIRGRVINRFSDRKHWKAARKHARSTHVATDPLAQTRYMSQVSAGRS